MRTDCEAIGCSVVKTFMHDMEKHNKKVAAFQGWPLGFVARILRHLAKRQTGIPTSCTCGSNFIELAHQPPSDGFRGGTTGFADPIEFHDVQPTLTQFQSANQIALTFQPSGQLPLVQPRFATQFHYGFANTLALSGINSFVHAPIMRASFGCTQIASIVSLEGNPRLCE